MAQDNKGNLQQQIENLINLVEGLTIELHQLRREQERLQSQEQERLRIDQQRLRDQEQERLRVDQQRLREQQLREPPQGSQNEFKEGDSIIILNSYPNQQGCTATVTRTFQDRVYFNLDG